MNNYLLLIIFSFFLYFFLKFLKIKTNFENIISFLQSQKKLFNNFKNNNDEEKQKILLSFSLGLSKYSLLILGKLIILITFVVSFFYIFKKIYLIFKLSSIIIISILFLIFYFIEKFKKKNA